MGNIIYFRYQSIKQKEKEILKNKLTSLFPPIYYILKNDELQWHAWLNSEAVDPYEYISDQPERLFKPIVEIVKNNLYLADDELHEACLSFIEWVYKSNNNDRFQRIHNNQKLEEDKTLENFRETIYKKYTKQEINIFNNL